MGLSLGWWDMVLLYMLFSELELDDKGVGSTRSWGPMNFCTIQNSPSNHILKDCLRVRLAATCWKEHFHPQWKTNVCLFDKATKTLTRLMTTKWKCVQVLWNLGEETTMYTLFPSMFTRMGFGYTHVHWIFGSD
jgi:hypothetical protein